MAKTKGMQAVNFEVRPAIHKAMRVLAAKRDENIKDLYAQAAVDFLRACGEYPIGTDTTEAHNKRIAQGEKLREDARRIRDASSR